MARTQETASAPLSVRRIIALCCAGGLLDGFDLLIMGAALLALVPHYHLSGVETGVITSLPYIGAAVGALAAGRLNDRFGRRLIYMFDVMLFIVLGVLLALSQTVWQLAVLRFLIGIAIGFDMPTGSSMIAEFSPRKLRGTFTAMMNTAWLLGGSLGGFVGFVLFRGFGEDAWRWMFAAAVVPAVIILALRAQLPESPHWLRAAGRTAEAEQVEARLPTELTSEQAPPGSPRRERADRGSWREVFVRPHRGRVAFFSVYWLWQALITAAPFTYTALIFSSLVDLSKPGAILLSATLLLVYVVASLACQFLVLDRFGRKPLAIGACIIAGMTGIPVALLQHSPVPLVLFFALSITASQMVTIPFWPWSVEQLPTRIRATGQSIGSASNKFGLFLGTMIFPPAVIGAIGWRPMFLGYAIGFLGLALFTALVGKETRGRDLESLELDDSPVR